MAKAKAKRKKAKASLVGASIKGMNPQQMRFVDEYCASKDLNASEAARRAGYSQKNADVTACRLMRTPAIKAEIERRRAQEHRKHEVKAEKLIARLAEIALEPLHADKDALRAVELLGKHMGMFVDHQKVEMSTSAQVHVYLPQKDELTIPVTEPDAGEEE